MDENEGGYVVVGTRDQPMTTHPHGLVWRLWARSTSFYIKARDSALGDIKVSLHGPDDRPDVGPPKFVYGFDSSVKDPTATPGVLAAEGFRSRKYPGERVAPDAHRVLRIRVPWDTLRAGDPSGVGKLSLSKGMDGMIVRPPSIGYAVDLDVFVSDGKPYWPASAAQMERDAAAIGPYRNSSGQVLTAASVHRSMYRVPTPDEASALPPMNRSDVVRGLHVGLPPGAEFPWVVETLMSRQGLIDLDGYVRPRPAKLSTLALPRAGTPSTV